MNDIEPVFYLEYLEPQVFTFSNNNETYLDLLNLMYRKEFVWLIPNDDNRVADGLDLRAEWFDNNGVSRTVMEFGPCTFLEVLISLSRRLEFMADESAEGWAWQLIINLGLHRMRDPLSRYKTQRVDDILETVIWRTYDIDGSGGFFPLARPNDDQRKIELWYQMNSYVGELHPEY